MQFLPVVVQLLNVSSVQVYYSSTIGQFKIFWMTFFKNDLLILSIFSPCKRLAARGSINFHVFGQKLQIFQWAVISFLRVEDENSKIFDFYAIKKSNSP